MNKTTHPLYNTWCHMRQRCNSFTNNRYAYYGGRGITVCDRWDDFWAFVEDMGERPDGTTLDRENTNGNYTPDNCRWATRKEQVENRRFYTVPNGQNNTSHISFVARQGRHPKYVTHFTLSKGVSVIYENECLEVVENYVNDLIFERDFYKYHGITITKP